MRTTLKSGLNLLKIEKDFCILMSFAYLDVFG